MEGERNGQMDGEMDRWTGGWKKRNKVKKLDEERREVEWEGGRE